MFVKDCKKVLGKNQLRNSLKIVQKRLAEKMYVKSSKAPFCWLKWKEMFYQEDIILIIAEWLEVWNGVRIFLVYA